MTDALEYGFDEATDMDEDVDGNPETEPPVAISRTGNWAAASTYDVYMVDTLKDMSKEKPNENPKLCRHKR